MFGIGRESWIRALLVVSVAACNHGTCQTEHGHVMNRSAAVGALTLDDYERIVYGPGLRATFVATTAAEHQVIAQLVPRLLELAMAAGQPDASVWSDLSQQASAVGFRLETWTIGSDRCLALLEAAGKSRGAGAYIFRVAPRSEEPVILLEAPHSYYDVGTGRLAAEVFFAPKQGVRPRALFTNTIHRYQLAPGDKVKRSNNPADVAHNREHAFSIATQAFVDAAGTARVVQFHGFGRRSDDDADDGGADDIAMVVSAGDQAKSSRWSAAVADALVEQFGAAVKRFPEQVHVLGATTNVQGQLVRNRNPNGFVHIEMSADMRAQLARDAAARAKLAAAVFDSIGDAEALRTPQ